jgi:hypothetical protein
MQASCNLVETVNVHGAGMSERIPAETILAQQRARGPRARWPQQGEGNRLGGHARLDIQPKFPIESLGKAFTIGSCFARSIEEHLARFGFEVPTIQFHVPPEEWPNRPNGILNKYTPPAFHQELEWTLRALDAAPGDAVFREHELQLDGGTVDLELGGFVKVTPERARERRVGVRDMFAHAFSADIVTLTLGLAEAWWDHQRQRYIQQMPTVEAIKSHPGRFAFEMLSYERARLATQQSLDLLIRHGKPGVKIFLTTSPVPLNYTFSGDDILVGNMHAKSMLRTVCGELAAAYPQVAYFPSYECVMLSDGPDVWEDDQIHVQEVMVGRIVDLLVSTYLQHHGGRTSPEA